MNTLADHIARRRPNAIGFSARNLWRMMQFYETYRDRPKLSPLVTELSWTNNLIILSRCKRDEEREFYLRLCSREKWGKRELERQLDGALFERVILSPVKLSPLVTELHPEAATIFKDTYLVEFADLPLGTPRPTCSAAWSSNSSSFSWSWAATSVSSAASIRSRSAVGISPLDLLFFNRALNCARCLRAKSGRVRA